MGFGHALRICLVSMLASMLVIVIQPLPSVAAAQGMDPLLKSSVALVVQGKNDVTPGDESNSDFYALKILSYDLPYDVARVHTRAPSSAQDFLVWTSTGEINNSAYGFETSGANAGDFFVDVPSAHLRTSSFVNVTDGEHEFNVSGSEFLNTTFSSGALRLAGGFDSGEYTSAEMQATAAHSITSATLNYSGNSSSNITSFVSNDGGTSWTNCQNNTQASFTTSGTVLRVKFVFEGNASAGYEPFISSFSVNATYILNSTIFTVHVSYVWTEDFADGEASLDFSEAADFTPDGSYLLMLYLVPGYGIGDSGLFLTFDEEGTMSSYPDKDLYYNMTSGAGQLQSYVVELKAPQKESTLLYYVAAIALVFALGLAYAFSRRARPSKRIKATRETETTEAEVVGSAEEPLSEEDEVRRRGLVARKKEMLAEIDDIRAQMSTGAVSKKDAEASLARLKKEFKGVRNELNRLSRKAGPPPSGPSTEPPDQSPSGYESLLAALARIDDDFEKGRLSESTYKSLRKEYVSKVAKVLSTEGTKGTPLEAEKKKLMEAIVALDDERETGEIDEKVYGELRASYRKQLVELMKKSERGSQ